MRAPAHIRPANALIDQDDGSRLEEKGDDAGDDNQRISSPNNSVDIRSSDNSLRLEASPEVLSIRRTVYFKDFYNGISVVL